MSSLIGHSRGKDIVTGDLYPTLTPAAPTTLEIGRWLKDRSELVPELCLLSLVTLSGRADLGGGGGGIIDGPPLLDGPDDGPSGPVLGAVCTLYLSYDVDGVYPITPPAGTIAINAAGIAGGTGIVPVCGAGRLQDIAIVDAYHRPDTRHLYAHVQPSVVIENAELWLTWRLAP